MKLNMGCGQNRKEGYINVDKFPQCNPDMVVDLEKFPWPWSDDSLDGVLFIHSLEHMGADANCFLQLMQELWRVCRPGALVEINVPHPNHQFFQNDPTHVRIITPGVLELFDRELNERWAKEGVTNTPLALYTGVDFKLVRCGVAFDARWQARLDNGEVDFDGVIQASLDFNNVIAGYELDLEVRKP